MELELKKHLAPYLPYCLKMKSPNGFRPNVKESTGVSGIVYLTGDLYADIENDTFNGEVFKPILRPLSYLTKEIEVNGKKFVPLVEIIKYLNFKFLRYEIKDNSLDVVFDNKLQTKERFWFSNFKVTSFYCSNMNKLMYKDIYGAINKLFEWHFDVSGLIEKGLAVDINTLK